MVLPGMVANGVPESLPGERPTMTDRIGDEGASREGALPAGARGDAAAAGRLASWHRSRCPATALRSPAGPFHSSVASARCHRPGARALSSGE